MHAAGIEDDAALDDTGHAMEHIPRRERDERGPTGVSSIG
jgi:hypothetical protein